MTSRSRLLSVAALTLCVVLSGPSLALAQETPEGSQEVHSQLDGTLTNSQTGKTYSVTSSTFPYGNLALSNKYAADDVIVPPGNEWWRVTAVSIWGELCLNASQGDAIALVVYYNSGALDSGSPSNVRQSVPLTGWSDGCASDAALVDFQLQTPIVLPSGLKYWISIQSSSNALDRKIFWATRGTALNQPAAYIGYGDCFSEWQQRVACVADVPGDDMAWSLTYSTFNGNAVYMPQLGRP
ncbi:MAG TPA: hypothetical protein PK954_25335 [Anaerolineales bacterium]|nr:hypothetical protein [Anaerolineales bacterium]HRF48454.1 hypothetical protein [Anaerolineales bacterium]